MKHDERKKGFRKGQRDEIYRKNGVGPKVDRFVGQSTVQTYSTIQQR